MNSSAFVLCPRCTKEGCFCPLNKREDEQIKCGLCGTTWPDLQSFLKEIDVIESNVTWEED